jgi:hypothetical protein
MRVTMVRSTSASGRVRFDGFRFGRWLRIVKSQGLDEPGNRQMNVQSITLTINWIPNTWGEYHPHRDDRRTVSRRVSAAR